MVDFKQMRIDNDKKNTPTQRAMAAWREISEATAEATAKRIPATFERLSHLRTKSTNAPETDIKQIPVSLVYTGSIVLDGMEALPEGRTVEVHKLSESPFYSELIGLGLVADSEFAVDVTDVSPVVTFNEAVTGYERFTLNDEFIRGMTAVSERNDGDFYICAGTRGRYDACKVNIDDVTEWMRGLDLPAETKALLSPEATAPTFG